MSVQTTYSDTLDAAVVGQRANQEPARLISRNVEDAAGIAFGLAVSQGTADRGAKAFGTGDTAILGISTRERSTDATAPDVFAENSSALVMTSGCIWVTASVAVNAGDPVYVIPATGAFAKTSVSSAVLIVGARWDTSTTGAALAVVRLA